LRLGDHQQPFGRAAGPMALRRWSSQSADRDINRMTETKPVSRCSNLVRGAADQPEL
jgi:hypothetical protein